LGRDDDWNSMYTGGTYRHWEAEYQSPELAALAAAQIVARGSRVLDVGCGGGLDAVFLAQCGFRVTGVDVSKAALAIAERRARAAGVSVDWRLGDVFELPVRGGSMGLVTDRGLFHVIEDSDRRRYASEIHRVLKPGGYLVLRGAGDEVGRERFNPVTEQAVDRIFSPARFRRGPVLRMPLYSVEGALEGRIVILQKTDSNRRQSSGKMKASG
jgi:ubiquinone/menaquinone biosynthesis C-methylase UbiE